MRRFDDLKMRGVFLRLRRYRDKTVDARPPSLRDFGHIGFSGVGVQKNRQQLVLFEPRDFLANENIDNVNIFRIADHQASLQVAGFSSPRSVKKPIGALAFGPFLPRKKDERSAFTRFSILQNTDSVRNIRFQGCHF